MPFPSDVDHKKDLYPVIFVYIYFENTTDNRPSDEKL